MKRRCLSPQASNFTDYGGRGITVCQRWLKFENFLADMGDRPEGKSLDRIDNDGNYEISNCRWSTPLEQSKNKRPRYSWDEIQEIHGRAEHGESQASIARRMGVHQSTISLIRSGKSWKNTVI